jgi:hypothetical protein
VWVYKCINGIRDAGFLEVIPHPQSNRYLANEDVIARAIQQAKTMRLSELKASQATQEERIGFLEKLDSHELAIHALGKMTGSKENSTARVVEGIENVRQTIIADILDVAKPGDVVRIHQDMESLSTIKGAMGPVESRTVQIATEGITVKGLLTGERLQDNDLGALVTFFQRGANDLIQAAMSGNLQFRMKPHIGATYRIVSLNRERMILILTKGAHPESVIFLTRESNPGLIDDAVDVFDSSWEESEDMMARFSQMLGASSSSEE